MFRITLRTQGYTSTYLERGELFLDGEYTVFRQELSWNILRGFGENEAKPQLGTLLPLTYANLISPEPDISHPYLIPPNCDPGSTSNRRQAPTSSR